MYLTSPWLALSALSSRPGKAGSCLCLLPHDAPVITRFLLFHSHLILQQAFLLAVVFEVAPSSGLTAPSWHHSQAALGICHQSKISSALHAQGSSQHSLTQPGHQDIRTDQRPVSKI